MKESISAVVKKCVERVLLLDAEEIALNRREDLEVWDSLAHMEIILRIEERFNLRLPEEKVAYIDTLEELIQLVVSTSESNSSNEF